MILSIKNYTKIEKNIIISFLDKHFEKISSYRYVTNRIRNNKDYKAKKA